MSEAATTPNRCEHCGHNFEADRSQIGGIVNCPNCGKATTVEGMRDPLWRLLQVGAGIGVVAVVFALTPRLGPFVAVGAGVVLAALLWLGSRGL